MKKIFKNILNLGLLSFLIMASTVFAQETKEGAILFLDSDYENLGIVEFLSLNKESFLIKRYGKTPIRLSGITDKSILSSDAKGRLIVSAPQKHGFWIIGDGEQIQPPYFVSGPQDEVMTGKIYTYSYNNKTTEIPSYFILAKTDDDMYVYGSSYRKKDSYSSYYLSQYVYLGKLSDIADKVEGLDYYIASKVIAGVPINSIEPAMESILDEPHYQRNQSKVSTQEEVKPLKIIEDQIIFTTDFGQDILIKFADNLQPLSVDIFQHE